MNGSPGRIRIEDFRDMSINHCSDLGEDDDKCWGFFQKS